MQSPRLELTIQRQSMLELLLAAESVGEFYQINLRTLNARATPQMSFTHLLRGQSPVGGDLDVNVQVVVRSTDDQQVLVRAFDREEQLSFVTQPSESDIPETSESNPRQYILQDMVLNSINAMFSERVMKDGAVVDLGLSYHARHGFITNPDWYVTYHGVVYRKHNSTVREAPRSINIVFTLWVDGTPSFGWHPDNGSRPSWDVLSWKSISDLRHKNLRDREHPILDLIRDASQIPSI